MLAVATAIPDSALDRSQSQTKLAGAAAPRDGRQGVATASASSGPAGRQTRPAARAYLIGPPTRAAVDAGSVNAPQATEYTAPAVYAAPIATRAPAVLVTDLATPDLSPTAVPAAALEIDGAATETPSTASTCAYAVDAAFFEALSQLEQAERVLFGCPTGGVDATTGAYLSFERGYMLHLDESPEVYVYYDAVGQWEKALTGPDNGTAPLAPADQEPPPGQFIPRPPFGALWRDSQRRAALGFATAPEPIQFAGVVQRFPGGIVIGNSDTGSVWVLLKSKLRI